MSSASSNEVVTTLVENKFENSENSQVPSENSTSNAMDLNEFKSYVRFIDLEVLKKLKEFPRCPEQIQFTTLLSDIVREDSLLIFVSHSWLRGTAAVPHPDNESNDKFKMCVQGLAEIKECFAPRMKNCYLWMDYCCMDQKERSAIPRTLKQFDKIVACCDLIFTPIIERLTHSQYIYNPFEDIQSELWNGTSTQSYVNRAWCRMEMFYAANIPILDNQDSDIKRHTMFDYGLAVLCRLDRRPHILYGDSNNSSVDNFSILPPLQNFWLTQYDPIKGNITDTKDTQRIDDLMKRLQHYIDNNKVNYRYEGERNEAGEKHGHGMSVEESGVYEGEWKNNKKDGFGRFSSVDGSVYEGEYRDGVCCGKGRVIYTTGGEYQGDFLNHVRHGQGTIVYSDGLRYEGEWCNGHIHGSGMFVYPNGTCYVGEIRNDNIEGYGIMYFANGSMYRGEWKHGKKEGYGTYHFAGGGVYAGGWNYDCKEGQGTIRDAKGTVHVCEFSRDAKHGKGVVIFPNGDSFEGIWNYGIPENWGVCRYASGSEYEGELKNMSKEGHGTYRCEEFVYEGAFKDNCIHGWGLTKFSNGDVHEGEWTKNKRNGRGTFRCAVDSRVLEGEWRDDVKVGPGRVTYTDGRVDEGMWLNDEFVATVNSN